MTRPRLLDLYCGAGGASAGYVAAGFDVIGVDLAAQPRYPHGFLQADVLGLDVRFLRAFDAVHASPPCQRHTALKSAPGAKAHEDLIPATRALLQAAGVPYVIENVEGAPLVDPVRLCGSMFGLGAAGFQLRRHRLFELSFPIWAPPCNHRDLPVIGVYGGHVRCRAASHGGRGTADFVGYDRPALACEAMDLWHMNMAEISQAIPPAYTVYIGQSLRAHLEAA